MIRKINTLKNNKKGAIGLVLTLPIIIVILVFLALVLLGAGFFLDWVVNHILLLLGGVIIVLGLIYSVNTKNPVATIAIVCLIGGGFIVLHYSGLIQQSILAVSQVYVGGDEKVYWLATGTASNIDEGYTFNYKVGTNVNDYTKNDGSIIKPQQSMSLYISKQDSYCYYRLTKNVFKKQVLGITLWEFNYYILNNPDRIANILLKDSNGITKTISGTTQTTATFADTDGKGQMTVQSQGLLSSNLDCPNYENVAIFIDNTGGIKTTYRSQVDSVIQTNPAFISELFAFFIQDISQKTTQNNQFLSSFSTSEINLENAFYKGDINLGSAVFTVTADQDYFDSVVFTPSAEVKPFIYDIQYPSTVQIEKSASINVVLRNRESSSGYVTVSAEPNGFSISPLETSVLLSNEKNVYFTASAGNQIGQGNIKFTVCSQSQFGSSVCDSETIYIAKISSQPTEYCGDGICQTNENYNTCSADCEYIPGEDNETIVCEWWQEPYTTTKLDYGFLGWRKIFNNPITHIESGCKTSGYIYLLIFGGIFIVIITILVLTRKKPYTRRHTSHKLDDFKFDGTKHKKKKKK